MKNYYERSGCEMKIGSIVIACYEFDKMLAFWQEDLHYIRREPANGAGLYYVILRGGGLTCL